MISVCMATFNGERFIKEQIDSILCQLSPGDELIVSDDGSTDATLEIIKSYNDPRIKLLHHKKNPELKKIKYSRNHYYVASNFENSLKQAKGDYIFLSDQDDIWLPEKITKMISALKDTDLAISNFNMINANGEIIKKSCYCKNSINNSFILNTIELKISGCCIAFNKNILKNSLPFPNNLIAHDAWIGLVASIKGKISLIKEPLINRRQSGFNVSIGTKNPVFFKIYYRLILLIQLYIHLKKKSFQKRNHT